TSLQRLPLVVMAYGFTGEFVGAASTALANYPARMLAQSGVAVLMLNNPRRKPWSGPDFAQGSVAHGWGPPDALRTARQSLLDEGLVDGTRVGFAGHSWGGFWVQFAITHGCHLAAAQTHNGGTPAEPGTYWITGTSIVRALTEHKMGGPPYGKTLA